MITSVSLLFSFQDNIAQGKPTAQSSTAGMWFSGYAVDGARGTNIFNDKCTHTDRVSGTTNPWWRVDLEELLPVSEVYVLNRGDCCGDRLNRFEIRVGKYRGNVVLNSNLSSLHFYIVAITKN